MTEWCGPQFLNSYYYTVFMSYSPDAFRHFQYFWSISRSAIAPLPSQHVIWLLENVLLLAFHFLKSSLDTVHDRKQEIAFSGGEKPPEPQWEGLTHVSEWQSWAKKGFSGTVLDLRLWFISCNFFKKGNAISLQKEMYRSECRMFLGCHEQPQWKAPSQCGNLGHEWSQFFHPACDITFCVFLFIII